MSRSLPLRLYSATGHRAERAERRALAQARRDGSAGADRVDRCLERLGEATEPRPEGPLLWVHSGRDRHALAACELVGRLRRESPGLHVLLTTSAERRHPSTAEVVRQLAPLGAAGSVRRFLDHWRPDLSLWTEADPRPVLVAEADARGIPLYLADAGTAVPIPQRLGLWPHPAGSLLAPFRHLLTGDADRAALLRRMGAEPSRIETPGYLEEGPAALPCNIAERDELAEVLSGRPVWFAASVLEEELPVLLDAHRAVIRQTHRLLLILAPAEPGAGPGWQARLRAEGFETSLRSEGAEPGTDTQIYIADTEDELGLWYRLAAVSFMGQSLFGGGGIDPFGAASLGSAVLHGPNVRNFRRAYSRLERAGAVRLIHSAEGLAKALSETLSPDVAATMAHAGWTVCTAGAEVTDYLMDLLLAELDAVSG